jgi:hypothetical protein
MEEHDRGPGGIPGLLVVHAVRRVELEDTGENGSIGGNSGEAGVFGARESWTMPKPIVFSRCTGNLALAGGQASRGQYL